jgi:hypothetical protein
MKRPWNGMELQKSSKKLKVVPGVDWNDYPMAQCEIHPLFRESTEFSHLYHPSYSFIHRFLLNNLTELVFLYIGRPPYLVKFKDKDRFRSYTTVLCSHTTNNGLMELLIYEPNWFRLIPDYQLIFDLIVVDLTTKTSFFVQFQFLYQDPEDKGNLFRIHPLSDTSIGSVFYLKIRASFPHSYCSDDYGSILVQSPSISQMNELYVRICGLFDEPATYMIFPIFFDNCHWSQIPHPYPEYKTYPHEHFYG